MESVWHALVVSAVATGSLAAAWYLWSRWNARIVRARVPGDVIDELNERQQSELLSELSQHV